MPKSLAEILAQAEALADQFEDYEPRPEDAGKASGLVALRAAVGQRARADQAVLEAVEHARADGISWAAIGKLLGTSGEAARQRYASLIHH